MGQQRAVAAAAAAAANLRLCAAEAEQVGQESEGIMNMTTKKFKVVSRLPHRLTMSGYVLIVHLLVTRERKKNTFTHNWQLFQRCKAGWAGIY